MHPHPLAPQHPLTNLSLLWLVKQLFYSESTICVQRVRLIKTTSALLTQIWAIKKVTGARTIPRGSQNNCSDVNESLAAAVIFFLIHVLRQFCCRVAAEVKGNSGGGDILPTAPAGLFAHLVAPPPPTLQWESWIEEKISWVVSEPNSHSWCICPSGARQGFPSYLDPCSHSSWTTVPSLHPFKGEVGCAEGGCRAAAAAAELAQGENESAYYIV